MSNYIDTVVDKQAYEQVNKLASGLENARIELAQFLKVASGNKTNFQNLKLPSDLENQLAKNSQYVAQLNSKLKEQEQINKKLESSIKKLNATRKSGQKALTDEEKLQRKLEQSRKRVAESRSKENIEIQRNRDLANQNNRAVKQAESFYGKVSLKLKKTAKEYKDLSVRKQILNDLSDKEIQRMALLEQRMDKYLGALKEADQKTGNYGRNVGNYKSAFDGMGFSVAQVTRELPAFANSAQTGFMAISNNIPMVVDEINKLRTANKSLAKEGKPTKSVLKSLGAAFFSFQTLISLAIVALTVYGDEIVDFVFQTSAAEKAQKKMNEALAKGEADAKGASQELRAYRDIVTDTTNSEEVRANALRKLQDEVEELEGVELDQKDAMQLVIDKTAPYIAATEARAKADAFARLAAEAEAKLLEEKAKDIQDNIKWYDYLSAAITSMGNSSIYGSELMQSGAKNTNKVISEQTTIMELLQEQYMKYMKESLAFGDILDENGNKTDENTDRLKVNALEIENTGKALKFSVKWFDDFIGVLQKSQKEVSQNSKEWQEYNKQIEYFTKLRDRITEIGDIQVDAGLEDMFNATAIESGMKNLSNMLGQDLGSLYKEFSDEYKNDYESFKEFQEKKLKSAQGTNKELKLSLADYMQMASDVLFEVGNLFAAISDAKIQKIDEEIRATNENYDNILKNEELTKAQREQIEKEKEAKVEKLEDKKTKEKEKAAKVDKAFAMFDIGINTAAAIMRTYAEFGFPLGVPLAITQGAIGALQLATVAAKPIPKYKEGRKDGKAEIAVVGDGGRREVVTDKDGNLKYITPDKPTLTHLAQGDVVHKSIGDYDNVMRASVMASLNSQNLNAAESKKAFDQELLMQTIKESFKGVVINNTNNNQNDALLRELKNQRRRDV